MLSYDTSSLPKSPLTQKLEALTEEVRRQWSKALEQWLDQCIAKWCPAAMELVKAGKLDEARELLAREGFHYRANGWNVTEFCQGETPLAAAIMEFRTINPEWVKLGPEHDWHFMFHREALAGVDTGVPPA